MGGRREGIVHENAQAVKNVCDQYGIVLTSSGNGYLKWRSLFYSDVD